MRLRPGTAVWTSTDRAWAMQVQTETGRRRPDLSYDGRTSTLVLIGAVGQDDWADLWQSLDQAFRRTACHLTVDLAYADLPPRDVGLIVQVCNRLYPNTMVRPPVRRVAPAA